MEDSEKTCWCTKIPNLIWNTEDIEIDTYFKLSELTSKLVKMFLLSTADQG